MTCRNAFASAVAPADLAECLRVSGNCWSKTELKTLLEFSLFSSIISPGLNSCFPLPI